MSRADDLRDAADDELWERCPVERPFPQFPPIGHSLPPKRPVPPVPAVARVHTAPRRRPQTTPHRKNPDAAVAAPPPPPPPQRPRTPPPVYMHRAVHPHLWDRPPPASARGQPSWGIAPPGSGRRRNPRPPPRGAPLRIVQRDYSGVPRFAQTARDTLGSLLADRAVERGVRAALRAAPASARGDGVLLSLPPAGVQLFRIGRPTA